MRGETIVSYHAQITTEFQSTPLMRGETRDKSVIAFFFIISIHSPHARGDVWLRRWGTQILISIHSPHARGDDFEAASVRTIDISIHSPHARGDKDD